jgi:2'-5' RNA ligase
LPEDIKRELVRQQEKLEKLFIPFASGGSFTGPAKWTNKEGLHVTLEFLDYLTDEQIVEVCKVTEEVAKRHRGFTVELNKILYGPPKKMPPRFIWTEGEKSDELADLKEDLQEYLVERIDFHPERKGFTPHITLARIKEWQFRQIDPEERPEINEEIDLTFSVESIEVMESELHRGGPRYTILQSCELKN